MSQASTGSLARVAGVILLLIVGIGTAAGAGHGGDKRILYEAPARTSRATIENGFWSTGDLPPLAPLSSQKNPWRYEVVSQRVVDCSDRLYRCVRSWGRTFAIPRGPLRPQQDYEKHGVVFHVEECLRGNARRCQVALIAGMCGHAPSLREMRCLPTPRSGVGDNAVYDYVIYFLYNEDFGITAFGATDHVVATGAGRLAIATQMILQSPMGLLAAR